MVSPMKWRMIWHPVMSKSHHFSGKMGVLRQAEDWNSLANFLIKLNMPVVIFLYQKFSIDFKRCERNTFDENFSTEIITNSIRGGNAKEN